MACDRGNHRTGAGTDGLDFLVLDEYASIAREAWLEVLRPALADRQGNRHGFSSNEASGLLGRCTYRKSEVNGNMLAEIDKSDPAQPYQRRIGLHDRARLCHAPKIWEMPGWDR